MASNKPRKPKPEAVGITAKLREAHPWIIDLTGATLTEAIAAARERWALEGPRLTGHEAKTLSDELEQIQRQLNPLEIRRDEILGKLKPHWGHTGIQEIVGDLGNTLISLSFEYCISDPSKIESKVTDGQWQKMTRRALDPKLALGEAEKDEALRKTLAAQTKVKKVKLSVTAPSSRRPKSGEVKDEEDE